jgi:anti-sigma B factor antagonist
LRLEASSDEGAVVLRCSGRLTATDAPTLKSEVKERLLQARRIVLDLTDLTFMDSSGLGTIVGLYVSARNANCELRLINLNKQIRGMLSLTNLLTLFEPCGKYPVKMV